MRSFILAIYNIEIVPVKKDEIGGTCCMCGANEKYTQYFGLWNLEDRENLVMWHKLGCDINTLPRGHAEMCDCYPMHCWQITHFYIFLHNILHMHLSTGLSHLLFQGYWQLVAGCLGLMLQTNQSWPPIFRTIRLQQRDHSFRYSVFLQLQTWLCVGMFCKRRYFVWVICGYTFWCLWL